MTLNELLSKPFHEHKNYTIESNDSHYQGVAGELGFFCDKHNDRYYSQFTAVNWECTDTQVGILAHYLDNELIALSHQIARKERAAFFWKSKELRDKMINYLYNLFEYNELNKRIHQLEQELSYLNMLKLYECEYDTSSEPFGLLSDIENNISVYKMIADFIKSNF